MSQRPLNARASYPSFLSLPETIWLQLNWALRGLIDSFRLDIFFSLIATDAEIRSNVFKTVMLNTVSLISIYTFDLLLQPLVRNEQKWLHRNVGWFYRVLWLFPVIGTSLYMNSSWNSTIAKRVFALRHGLRAVHQQPPATYTGMLTSLATSAYRGIMVVTSVVISLSLSYVPIAGPTLGFMFMCWIDSYYCFEYVWISRGLSLSRRVRHLEERWAYYLAFGLPSAAMCCWGSSLANAAIFALSFPMYIILAIHARPVPTDPYNPIPSSTSNHSVVETVRHPSPFIPIRLPIFLPVIWLNDWIVRILSIGQGERKLGGVVNRGMHTRRTGRLSTELAESAEQGERFEMKKSRAEASSMRRKVSRT